MIPSVLLVCDPAPKRAQLAVAGMIDSLETERASGLLTDSGADWAAAAIPPPGSEVSCGADILVEGHDVLLWAGEIFLPDDWPRHPEAPPRRAIGLTLLNTLQRHGVDALGKVDGGFCGAWYDAGRRRWIVFNDKFGQIPVFWSASEDRLVVSPRAAVTWRASSIPLEISEAGVTDLIRTQNMTEDHTLIKGVYWLKRGHALFWGEEGAAHARYWDFQYRPEQVEDPEEALDNYIASITTALRRHSECRGPLLLGVSGGLDSRLFLAVCEQLGRIPRCFTAGWPFYEDVRFGRQLARLAGASHELALMDAATLPALLEEGIRDTDGLQGAGHLGPTMAAREWLRQQTDAVLLEGFFHGMVGGCTVPADDDVGPDKPPHARRWARTLLHAGGDIDFINDLLLPELARDSHRDWQARVDEAYRIAPVEDALHRAEYAMINARRGRVDVLGTALLRRDVLVRNPASDGVMVEWHQTTSPRLRRARGIYLAALRKRFPRFGAVPRSDGCGGMPILQNRLLREYHWQREKLYRWFIGLRQPWTRRWGINSKAIRAWMFDTWRRSGRLDVLLEADARILNWVRGDRLRELWAKAAVDSLQAEPLLTLATIELAVRHFESLSAHPRQAAAVPARTVRIKPRTSSTAVECLAAI